jgi:hypothetical protein
VGEDFDAVKEYEIIQFLKHKTVRNSSERDFVANNMSKIKVNRLWWILKIVPSITEILQKLPSSITKFERY